MSNKSLCEEFLENYLHERVIIRGAVPSLEFKGRDRNGVKTLLNKFRALDANYTKVINFHNGMINSIEESIEQVPRLNFRHPPFGERALRGLRSVIQPTLWSHNQAGAVYPRKEV